VIEKNVRRIDSRNAKGSFTERHKYNENKEKSYPLPWYDGTFHHGTTGPGQSVIISPQLVAVPDDSAHHANGCNV